MSTRQGNLYTYQVQATDPEGDRLTYSLVNPPAGMQIQNGLIVWNPIAAQSGDHTITARTVIVWSPD